VVIKISTSAKSPMEKSPKYISAFFIALFRSFRTSGILATGNMSQVNPRSRNCDGICEARNTISYFGNLGILVTRDMSQVNHESRNCDGID
jgi:hypothetical protein